METVIVSIAVAIVPAFSKKDKGVDINDMGYLDLTILLVLELARIISKVVMAVDHGI